MAEVGDRGGRPRGGSMVMEFEAVFFFMLVVSGIVGSACYGHFVANMQDSEKVPVRVRRR